MNTCDPNALIEKVKALPAERLAEVEDFVDFLRMRLDDSALVTAAAKRSEEASGSADSRIPIATRCGKRSTRSSADFTLTNLQFRSTGLIGSG